MKQVEWLRRAGQVSMMLGLATLTSCGMFERWQSGEFQTDRVAGRDVLCDAAIANRTHEWQVRYVINRTTHDNQREDRVETFASESLSVRNGQPPEQSDAVNIDGEWWPSVPPRPDFADIDEERRSLERADMPTLNKQAEFFLNCEVGELHASELIYSKALMAFQQGQSVRATHGLGRIANIQISSAASAPTTTNLAPHPDRFPTQHSETAISLPRILHVDGKLGEDSNNGTASAPYATISRALANARHGDTVKVAPGTYTEETNERFPLEVKAGVTLAGNSGDRGNGIFIQGGGKYISPSWMRQDVAILAKDNATVTGLTVGNPNVRGTGVWIEVGTVEIANNTFADNHREGVFVAGDAAPEIRNNVFVNNGGNGVSYTRNSGGIFTGNIIRSSGYGMAIGDMASPTVTNNDLRDNQYGFVISGDAQPSLKDNAIANSTRDGIVVTNNARPNLQGNAIANSGQYDLNNNTGLPIDLEGNAIATAAPPVSE